MKPLGCRSLLSPHNLSLKTRYEQSENSLLRSDEETVPPLMIVAWTIEVLHGGTLLVAVFWLSTPKIHSCEFFQLDQTFVLTSHLLGNVSNSCYSVSLLSELFLILENPFLL